MRPEAFKGSRESKSLSTGHGGVIKVRYGLESTSRMACLPLISRGVKEALFTGYPRVAAPGESKMRRKLIMCGDSKALTEPEDQNSGESIRGRKGNRNRGRVDKSEKADRPPLSIGW